MKTKIDLVVLVEGQIVAIANHRDLGIVVSRTGKNRYIVSCPQFTTEIARSQLSTYVRGAWRPNVNAGNLAPHLTICGEQPA